MIISVNRVCVKQILNKNVLRTSIFLLDVVHCGFGNYTFQKVIQKKKLNESIFFQKGQDNNYYCADALSCFDENNFLIKNILCKNDFVSYQSNI